MPAPKRSPVSVEKVLERAIAEGTQAVQLELAAAQKRVQELEALLGRIAALAGGQRVGEQVSLIPVEKKALPVALAVAALEPPVPEGEEEELASDDNLGPGRWA